MTNSRMFDLLACLPRHLPRWLAGSAGLMVAAAALAANPADSSVGVPVFAALFQDHAVLQRDHPVPVWGTAAAGEVITVRLAGARAVARAGADGAWRVALPPLPAGGPYRMELLGGRGSAQVLEDVLVGDVWLCSGQSNMELPINRALDARSEIAGAHNPRIRLLTVPKASAATPRATFSSALQWQQVEPESVSDFSAACYYFARELQKQVDVPMGLIHASWGGSRIQAWMSAPALRAQPGHGAALDVLSRYASDPAQAVSQWSTLWQGWWQGVPGVAADDQPWNPALPAEGDWKPAPATLGAWERWGDPTLADFNGMVWFATTFEATATQAAQRAELELGPVDEVDQTWVNGRGVGSSYGADQARNYLLPVGTLKAGSNDLVVSVLDTYRDGGITGPAAAVRVHFADGSSVALDGPWRYRAMPADFPAPPNAPWQSASGLSTLYNGMVAPLGPYGLRGVVWYQGESNTGEADRYARLLASLRTDWRRQFGEDTAWLIVQLANFGPAPTVPAESGWAGVREAQRRVAEADPRSALAITVDIGDRYDIHPANKQELGRRLARAARATVYHEDMAASGPHAIRASRRGTAIAVTFSDVTDGLVAYGATGPIGFELCGSATDACRYASARLEGNRVVLQAETTMPATRVRYCWADSPVCTLADGNGLPAGPFEIPVESGSR